VVGERLLGAIVVGSVYKAVSHPAPIVIDESCPRRSIEMASKVPCDTLYSLAILVQFKVPKNLPIWCSIAIFHFTALKLFDTRK